MKKIILLGLTTLTLLLANETESFEIVFLNKKINAFNKNKELSFKEKAITCLQENFAHTQENNVEINNEFLKYRAVACTYNDKKKRAIQIQVRDCAKKSKGKNSTVVLENIDNDNIKLNCRLLAFDMIYTGEDK